MKRSSYKNYIMALEKGQGKMMKQYCRYCSWFVTGNGDWCEKLNKEMSESAAKSPNKCGAFLFNKIDAYDMSKVYKPREKPKKTDCQPSLFGVF